MENIKQGALNKALNTLNALGCKYAVIDEDGNKHGTLEVMAAKTGNTKRPSFFPKGEVKNHVMQYIGNIQVGDVKEVPYGKYGGNTIQSSVSSFMHHRYGSGAHTSSQNHAKKALEVLRLA